MKSARQIMDETDPCKIGLALIYMENERQLFDYIHEKDDIRAARQEGIMHGILTAATLLGVHDFYGKTITDLRFAIQEERKKRSAECKRECNSKR